MSSWIHAIVDGEVTADEICPHGGILPSQGVGLKNTVCLVFPVIDADNAGMPGRASIGLVLGLWPAAASAETYSQGIGYSTS
ncbi:hypothetical protein BDV23DRAFT_151955 [Aspergillus alliaceus]|uniref:Uncharacterized protein n=1 Tax=Petromyces alliaceus TaxID=209559 RepID=A0A5N7CEQ3_PETAA|nr:hypothetical protein BDV23DRAFT_151955 [Aspergillus alliaceus]